jgi:hypothetical protein
LKALTCNPFLEHLALHPEQIDLTCLLKTKKGAEPIGGALIMDYFQGHYQLE